MSDLIITRIFVSRPEFGFGVSKPTGIGFIANHEILIKLAHNPEYWEEFTGQWHKTEFGDIYLLNVNPLERTFEFVAKDELKIPKELIPILLRRRNNDF